MARDVRVAFKLAEDKKELLQQYADSYGITMSALCALIVGQWLHQQENVAKPILNSVTEVVRETVRKELENEESLEVLLRKALETDRK
uniref:CopG family transcriptional regulator n=2 Tax=Geobacillus sp. 1121 TaxID=1273699 RepID=V5QQH5_9BACL|nr:hypothetical protein [Geobacillus sp. 1121]